MSTPNASQSRLSVGIVVLKRLSDDRRHQAVDRLAKLKPLTDGGGGHLKRPATQYFATERHGELGNRLTRARNHDERDQFGQVGGLTPLRQRQHVVGADEIMQSGLGGNVRRRRGSCRWSTRRRRARLPAGRSRSHCSRQKPVAAIAIAPSPVRAAAPA